MVVVDTSAWLEWLIGSATARRIEPHLPPPTDWVVPTIVKLELARWLTHDMGEERADQVIAFTQICHVVALDTRSALVAASKSPGPASRGCRSRGRSRGLLEAGGM